MQEVKLNIASINVEHENQTLDATVVLHAHNDDLDVQFRIPVTGASGLDAACELAREKVRRFASSLAAVAQNKFF